MAVVNVLSKMMFELIKNAKKRQLLLMQDSNCLLGLKELQFYFNLKQNLTRYYIELNYVANSIRALGYGNTNEMSTESR